jgi:serine/threonine-protein kinase
MGKVIAAEHVVLGHRVALKIMRPELVDSPVALKRFDREMRTTARLRSENTVRVLDVETLPPATPVIVMEHLDGYSLERLVFARAVVSPQRAASWGMAACRALAEAHALGIVHRDIKPENLFLASTRSGEEIVKVLDFGLAKCRDESEGSRATAAATTVGSPQYMSPEQVLGGDLDARADIWSLGATLYELLAGKPPFQERDMRVLFERILYTRPTPLDRMRPDLPPGLVAVLMRCLERDPSHRWQGARDLEAALARCFGPAPQLSYAAHPARAAHAARAGAPSEPPPLAMSRTARPTARPPRAQAQLGPRAWVAVLAGAALGTLAFGAMGAGFALALRARPPAVAAPPPEASPLPSAAAPDEHVRLPARFVARDPAAR